MRPEDRENNVAEVLAKSLLQRDPGGSTLVVGEATGRVWRDLEERGGPLARWDRFALEGERGAPEPEGREYSSIALRLPKSRHALRMTLHLLAGRLKEGGALTLAGANDEGAKSCGKTLREVFREVETVDTRRHCRVWQARLPQPGLRTALDDWAERFEADSPVGKLAWWSYPGCFAHGRLDAGSLELMKHLPATHEPWRVLDFACGPGALSLAVRGQSPQVSLTLCDADAWAVRAARRGLPDAEVVCHDGLPTGERRQYDLIMSNPPLHQGVGSSHHVLERFLTAVPDWLAPKGRLLLVTQKSVPIGRYLALGSLNVVAEGKGFRVWAAQR